MATTKAARKATKKSPVKKAAVKKRTSKAVVSKRTTATKVSAEKSSAKSAAETDATKTASTRKYSPSAGEDVEREMRAMQQGKLTIDPSGKKVTNPKQAIAIGLSEARKEGKKVPPSPKRAA